VAQEALAELVVQEAREALEALAELVVRVAREALAELVVQVAPAELVVRVALADLVIVPVEEELEHDQAAVEPARNHPPAQLAVAPKIKSVTAAHRRDLVPLLAAEEDLAAAVAGTTREPAAAEAVIAWEVAE
jgi:hypothetical protein